MVTAKTPLRSLVVYCSVTGNTRRVAETIKEALEKSNVSAVLREVGEAAGEELYDYDLVLLGSPSITFLPAAPMVRFLERKLAIHRDRGDIRPCAPQIPGKHAAVFVTYSGPHTGIREATTAGKYMGQFLEHLGFGVPVEWYVVGEYHGNPELSTKGRLGDVRGRPSQQDLEDVRSQVRTLVTQLA
jgi:multimeric flavodoxin WrbA